ncbi:hypothetical protein ACET3Z_008913 [Daucus carota]
MEAGNGVLPKRVAEARTDGAMGEGDKATEAFPNDGIKARQGINLLDILQKAGLHFNTPYTKAEIVNTMQRQLGVANVNVTTTNSNNFSHHNYLTLQAGLVDSASWLCPSLCMLREILICLDKMTHRIISCPPDNKPRSCTGTHLKIPQ